STLSSVTRQCAPPVSTVASDLPAGTSLSQGTRAILRTRTPLAVPSPVRGRFSGTGQVFQQTMNSQLILLVAAIATIYVVLVILYESYVRPLTILSTLPSAGVGTLLAPALFKSSFSLIPLIGIMLLIDILKKNDLMRADFALERHGRGGLNAEKTTLRARAFGLRTTPRT
ncbi:efflux RND transporter permease subunit, partial [Salmonella enterica]|uniref:efflux RND transporter permease subunit n=1 Tax=Salmonella enterica TaxID=28901 RepID=UPI00398C5A45